MTFPANNLPTASRTWGREVEKKVTNLEGSFRSAEVNNVTRDSQLSVTVNAALSAATQAQSAIDSIIDLSSPGGPAINAANITAGSISGDRISGGEIIGATLKTAASGTRVEIQQTSTAYFDQSNNLTGRILGGTGPQGVTLEIASAGSGKLQVSGVGAIMRGAGDTFAALSDNGFAVGGNRLYTIGVNIESGAAITAAGSISGASLSTGGSITGGSVSTSGAISGGSLSCSGAVSGGSISTFGTVSAGSVSSSGAISGTTVSATNFSGTTNTSIANNTTGSFAGNVFINTSGTMFRSTTTSSREAKENITPYEFDAESFISVSPVTFNYKSEAVSNPEEADIKQLGFILEDFEDAGLGEHLVIPANEVDVYKGLRYDKLYMFLHKVVQEQSSTIKDLTARLETLESR